MRNLGMKYEKTWDGRDGGDAAAGGAAETLTSRADRMLDRLTAKLARHNRDAEQLAEAMQQGRRKP